MSPNIERRDEAMSWRLTAYRRALEVYGKLSFLAMPGRIFFDVTAWVAAVFAAVYLRLDLSIQLVLDEGFIAVLPIIAVVQLITGTATGIYRRRWRYGSFDEMAALLVTASLNFTGIYLLNEFYFSPRPVPQSAVLIGSVFGLVAMIGVRFFWRLGAEFLRRPADPSAERLLIYGDGESAAQVVRALLSNPSSPYLPVGLLDDRYSRQRLKVMGVPVVGTLADLEEAARVTRAASVLVAMRRADASLLELIANVAASIGIQVKVLPGVEDVLGSDATAIRDLAEEDLLGRRQVETNILEIAGYVRGKTVLVTGAGGSIGSELCRQLRDFEPHELIMLDRDESALHAVQLSIEGRALLDTPSTLLADIRDAELMETIFMERRPDVVFHAAALKHLPLLEQYPAEAFKTNVVGTLNVLQAARQADVEAFVNVSTDKAANPSSVLGQSKRVAEFLTAAVGWTTTGSYLSVRFGNVLGSRGSVLVSFREQIACGGPVTVTDPEVTRFFMTVTEAVQLVIQAGAIGDVGEVLVLDMGEPVRIHDVARRLIAQSGRNIEIVFTGLRPGEKRHEELFGSNERDHRPRHGLISHAAVPPLDPSELPNSVDPDVLADFMVDACRTEPRFVAFGPKLPAPVDDVREPPLPTVERRDV